MPDPTNHTVTLAPDHSRFIDRKLASGEFASASDVVNAGLAAMVERELRVERWLADEVLPALQEAREHPETVSTAAAAKARLLRKLDSFGADTSSF